MSPCCFLACCFTCWPIKNWKKSSSLISLTSLYQVTNLGPSRTFVSISLSLSFFFFFLFFKRRFKSFWKPSVSTDQIYGIEYFKSTQSTRLDKLFRIGKSAECWGSRRAKVVSKSSARCIAMSLEKGGGKPPGNLDTRYVPWLVRETNGLGWPSPRTQPASGQNWLMPAGIIELVTSILRIRFVNGITYATLVSQFTGISVVAASFECK